MNEEEIEAWDARMLRFIADRAAALGEASGLDDYYLSRLGVGAALRGYERWFLRHLGGERRLFHAGIGIGALTAGLAVQGVRCVGFELDRKRFEAAIALRDAEASGTHYAIRRARFPAGIEARDRSARATLLFTNVGSGWDEEQTAQAIAAIGRFRRAFLDLRLFGMTREAVDDRRQLAARLVAAGFEVTPIDVGAGDAHYVQVRPIRRRSWWRGARAPG